MPHSLFYLHFPSHLEKHKRLLHTENSNNSWPTIVSYILIYEFWHCVYQILYRLIRTPKAICFFSFMISVLSNAILKKNAISRSQRQDFCFSHFHLVFCIFLLEWPLYGVCPFWVYHKVTLANIKVPYCYNWLTIN